MGKGNKFKYACIFCGSKDLEYSVMEIVDEHVTQKVDCNKCNKGFSIFSMLDWKID